MRLSAEAERAILSHARLKARLNPPEEMAGIINKNGVFVPLANIASEKEHHFALGDGVLAMEPDAICHSHPGGLACPSHEDMAQQQASGLPWVIAVVATSDNPDCMEHIFSFGGAIPKPSMLREYRHGTSDCYSLIRSYYCHERKIDLPDYPRGWEWWHEGGNLYEENFRDCGFYELSANEALEEGDVFLASIRSRAINHGGVYLGSGLIFHHLAGSEPYDPTRLPRKEPIERWSKFIQTWLRFRA